MVEFNFDNILVKPIRLMLFFLNQLKK